MKNLPMGSQLFLALLVLVMTGVTGHAIATDIAAPTSLGNRSTNADSGDAAPAIPTNSPTAPSPISPPPPAAATLPANSCQPPLVSHDLPEIHAKISLPKDWTLIPGKLLEGEMLLATKEKISGDTDPWTTGLSMTIDRNGAKDSGQKASEYAMGLARELNEKAGDEATPIKQSQSGVFHEISFEFPVEGDQPLQMTEVMRANDSTGTLAVILWQSPKAEALKLEPLKESILAGLKLDPNQ